MSQEILTEEETGAQEMWHCAAGRQQHSPAACARKPRSAVDMQSSMNDSSTGTRARSLHVALPENSAAEHWQIFYYTCGLFDVYNLTVVMKTFVFHIDGTSDIFETRAVLLSNFTFLF